MSDDDEICGCIILLVLLYVIYKVIIWLIDKYGGEIVGTSFGILTIIIVTIFSYKKILKDAISNIDKGKAIIKFGMIWFVSIFILSILIDVLFTQYYQNDNWVKGSSIFVITTFINMPGTSLLFHNGVEKLILYDQIEYRIKEGRKIIYFGIFWFFFWIFVPIILIQLKVIENDVGMSIAFIVPLSGLTINLIIGRWSSKIDVKKGWEYLNDAQKKLNVEKDKLKEHQKDIQYKLSQLEQQDTNLRSHLKELKSTEHRISLKQKILEDQERDIRRAREGIQSAYNELEKILDNPFPFFISKRLHKNIFLTEIDQLKKTKPGDISSIETDADKIISEIEKKLKDEIINIEDQYYQNAFLEYFKNDGHDIHEYDRIRTKYNPTIHMTGRRNRKWAEKRRFELSRIEKLLKEK